MHHVIQVIYTELLKDSLMVLQLQKQHASSATIMNIIKMTVTA